MGALTEEQLRNSLASLENANKKLAKSVIERDARVNKIELEITAQCAKIIALRQPTASDLRLILAVEKSITDLERIGDLSADIAKLSNELISKGISTRYYSELQELGRLAQQMLSSALNAFARLSAENAIETMTIRKNIKDETDKLSRQLITYMQQDAQAIKHILRILNATKDLERIGCHCENLCEYVVYLVKGEDIRYQNFDEIRATVFGDDD